MLSGQFRWVFIYVLPPLLGAGIGYLTNALAIRMLFRPLTEKRVFGIKIPLTPGIIPKYRYQLAENIGDMVSRELLSHDLLLKHLKSEPFRDNALEKIGEWTTVLLKRKAGEMIPVVRDVLRSTGGNGFSGLLRRLKKTAAMDHAGRMPLKDILPFDVAQTGKAVFDRLYPALMEGLVKSVRNPETKEKLALQGREFLTDLQRKMNIFQKFMINAGRYDKTLRNKMPEIMDDLIDRFESFASERENRAKIVDAVGTGLKDWSSISFRKFLTQLDLPGDKPAGRGGIVKTLFAFRHTPLGTLLGIDRKKKKQVDEWLLRFGIDQMAARLDALLAIVDVRKLVVDRINGLNIEDVERLLLLIIEKHLTWINIFGAILGAMIGAVQILIRLIG